MPKQKMKKTIAANTKPGRPGSGRNPVGSVHGRWMMAEKVEQADDQDQGSVLEQADEGVDDAGDHQLQRLRQDDEIGIIPARRSAPSAIGASYWPLGMACSPPRTTSAM
jgi:hypothetical protein